MLTRLAFLPTALTLLGVGGCALIGKDGPSSAPVPPRAAVDSVSIGLRPAGADSTRAASARAAAEAISDSALVHAATPQAQGGMLDSTAIARDSLIFGPRTLLDSLQAVPDSAAPSAARRAGKTPAAAHEGIDYLWVLRGALNRPSSIDSVVARARRMGVRGLLVQVVGRGDAYYRSDLLPRAEALWGSAPDFDPLAELIARAHPAGLEVHAWMNCMLVWSAPHRPRDPRHVLHTHPEWVARLRDGRRMSNLRPRDLKKLGVEGVFLTPAHPGVRKWVASVAGEIAQRYPVNGIHLDYIRQPGAPVGYDPTTRARFALESGVDPERLSRVAPGRRAALDSAWKSFQQRQVTATVREVRDSVEAARPGVSLSAAVIADTITAERTNAQNWRSWVKQGLVDRAFPMCYAPSVQKVMDQLLALVGEFGATERLVPGIAVFNTPLATAAVKLKGARQLGFPDLALYSYDSLVERSPGWSLLSGLLKPPAVKNP
jgi:uncharacterized lipoprotein YddW (UPF0748 family)